MLIAKIPGKLNNRTLISVLEFMRRFGLIFRKKHLAGISSRNYSANIDAMRAHESEGCGGHEGSSCESCVDEDRRSANRRLILINDQREFADVHLGKSDLSYSGCEVIAAYNLLQSIDRSMYEDQIKCNGDDTNHAPALPELISGLEKKGLIRSGYFGISPKYLAGYIKSLSSSFEVFFTTDEKLFDEAVFSHDHFILTVMNDRENIFKQIHTFYISKSYTDHLRTDQKSRIRTDQNASEESGKVTVKRSGILLRAYNAGINGYYSSATELIKDLPGGRAKGICLIGVRLKTAGRKPKGTAGN